MDIDAIIKSVLDCLNKKVIDDDKNILILKIYKQKIKKKSPDGLRVLVGQIDPIYTKSLPL
jgi:Holliday junction resolvase RusA-like endonuclease